MISNHPDLATKYQDLQDILKEMGRVLIAFSGGVDRNLLLKVGWVGLFVEGVGVTALSGSTAGQVRGDAGYWA